MSATVHNYSTYSNLGCRCPSCREANRKWQARARVRRGAALAVDPSRVQHGRNSTYLNHLCRCAECTDAHTLYAARLRLHRAAAGAA